MSGVYKRKSPARPRFSTFSTEEQIQRAIVQWARLQLIPEVIFFHVPNGEKRSLATGARLKAMGVLAGVPDLVLMWGGIDCHPRILFVEVKTPKGRVSRAQKEFVPLAGYVGAKWEIARSLGDFIAICGAHGVPMYGRGKS